MTRFRHDPHSARNGTDLPSHDSDGGNRAPSVGLVRGVQKKSGQPKVNDAQSLQLEQLQQSVDAIAVEVERIAEAQRFSAKLLAERAEPAALKRASST